MVSLADYEEIAVLGASAASWQVGSAGWAVV